MSNQVNTNFYEEVEQTLELADFHIDYWVGTQWEDRFDLVKAQVIKDIDNNDIGRLYENSLPALNELLKESAKAMFDAEYNPGEPSWI